MELSGKAYHLDLNISAFFSRLVFKVITVAQRLLDILLLFPKRIRRLGNHLLKGVYTLRPRPLHWWESELDKNIWRRLIVWWLECSILVMECVGIGEVYEGLLEFTKFNTRALTDWEIKLAQTIFGNSINYKKVRIDESAFAGPKQMKFCYVSFYTINAWGAMQNSLLLHELTHVWQYQKIGAVYMSRALRAQKSILGYNYGGVSGLKAQLKKGKTFMDFNLEQQGDIVADYYRIKEGYKPQWGRGNISDLPIYEKFVQELRK